MTAIKDLADINAKDIACLNNAGVRTTEQLLELGSTASARHRLADDTTLDAGYITYLVHLADLMRIEHIGPATAALLCEHGVTTAAKLAYRNARSLYDELVGSGTKQSPSIDELQSMITSAKSLSKTVYH